MAISKELLDILAEINDDRHQRKNEHHEKESAQVFLDDIFIEDF